MVKNIIIETKRLNIREFNLKDTIRVYKLSNEAGIKKWLPDQVYKDEKETIQNLEF